MKPVRVYLREAAPLVPTLIGAFGLILLIRREEIANPECGFTLVCAGDPGLQGTPVQLIPLPFELWTRILGILLLVIGLVSLECVLRLQERT